MRLPAVSAPKWPLIATIGIVAVLLSTDIFVYQQASRSVTPNSAMTFELGAIVYFLVLIFGIAVTVVGFWGMIQKRILDIRSKGQAPLSPTWIIPYVLSQRKFFRYFVVSALLYGVFYAFVTSVIVYQPAVNFVNTYGATFPSVAILSGSTLPLYTPVVTVYFVNHLGLLLIPLTLVLLVLISTLVGLNFALSAFAFDSRKKGGGRGWVGGMGAIVGLFTGCPTCAGLFFANALGGVGAVSFVSILSSYQPAFLLLSIPVLLLTPSLVSRSLAKVYRDGCVAVRTNSR